MFPLYSTAFLLRFGTDGRRATINAACYREGHMGHSLMTAFSGQFYVFLTVQCCQRLWLDSSPIVVQVTHGTWSMMILYEENLLCRQTEILVKPSSLSLSLLR